MLATALLIPLAGGLVSQNFLPTSEDHLRSPPGEKRVTLVLDVSGSMSGGVLSSPSCVYFNATHGVGPPYNLAKIDQLKAALEGCVTGLDGLFDQWAAQIDFAIVTFGNDPGGPGGAVRHNLGFTRNIANLESTVDSLIADWSTPMSWGLMEGNVQHQAWTDAVPNTHQCDQHFNILMTDGIPNDPDPPDYNFLPCGGPIAYPGAQARSNPVPVASYSRGGAPWGTTSGQIDAVCGLTGQQPITTYTIGFGSAGEINPTLLTNVANAGGGRYYYAADASQLSASFGDILNQIANRSVSFAQPSIQTDGLFVGNDLYGTSFRPESDRPWIGNVKSYCVVPPVDVRGNYVDEAVENRCIFKSVAGVLVTNPSPRDRFAGGTSLDTDSGGAGQVFYQDYYNGRAPFYSAGGDQAAFRAEFGPGNAFFSRRNVITWNNSGYKSAVPSNMTDQEAFASGCEKTKLFAHLHGYDAKTVDCNNNEPINLGAWPFGASVNSSPVLLRWAQDCSVPGHCIVAFGADDGGIHFLDSANGHETAMLVPRETFVPGQSGNYPLSEVMDQPTSTLARRSYVDGPLMRIHDDTNGDGIIQSTETAYLVVTLGKGGKGIYFMDVHNPFPAGAFAPDTTRNPVYPILPTPGNWTENMRDQMSKPWVGRVRFNGAVTPNLVAMFPSGHLWYLDRPTELLNNPLGMVGLQPAMDFVAPQALSCAGGNDFAFYNNYNPSGADFCQGLWTPFPFFPFGYDCVISGCTGVARDQVFGPLWYANARGPGATPARSIGNFVFTTLDLENGRDYLVFEDVNGNALSAQLTGNLTASGPYTVPIWINEPFRIRVHVDGNFSGNRGINLASMSWIPDYFSGGCLGGNPCAVCDTNNDGQCSVAEVLGAGVAGVLCDINLDGQCRTRECGSPDYTTCGVHRPFVAMVDLTRINGATPQAWAQTTANGSLKLMFTKICPAGTTVGTNCFDQTQASTRDLQYMTCPITAEPRAYEEGGVARNWYVGDQCGQMWKFWTPDSGRSWFARRPFVVNATPGGGTVASGQSRDTRHFDKPVDLAISTCRGNRSIGVYFGTGNTARPGATDSLSGPTRDTVNAPPLFSARYRDIIGVWFDDNAWDPIAGPRTISSFKDVTGNPTDTIAGPNTFSSADAQPGWFVRLAANEQMLREPLVINGVAYFKTNQPTTAGTTCVPARTLDTIYAVNNCTAAPSDTSGGANHAVDVQDRAAWTGDTAVGGGLLLYTPKNGTPIISSGDLSRQQNASIIPTASTQRAIQMYLWWRGI